MYHAIAVNYTDNAVSDGLEKKGLRFVYEVFGYCLGDDAIEVHVKEVKEICSQPEGKKKLKLHKISADKKERVGQKHVVRVINLKMRNIDMLDCLRNGM